MLRLLIVVPFSVMAISGYCQAQYFSYTDTMFMEPVSGSPNDTLSVAMDMVNTFAVGGFQIRATYGDSTFAVLDMQLASRANALDLHGAYLDQPGVASFYATSWNPLQNAIMPGRGPVVILRLTVLPGAQPGIYYVRYEDTDSTSHENSFSNMWGDSLVIPLLSDTTIQVLPVSGIDDNTPVPSEFGLSQNYPNPFNGSTRITFTLNKAQVVDLTVFDMLGRPVATIYSGWAQSGENAVYWDPQAAGKSVASGSYFYRLKCSQFGALTKMMTLLK